MDDEDDSSTVSDMGLIGGLEDVNPEGYGIEEFQPVAVFEMISESQPTDDKLFDDFGNAPEEETVQDEEFGIKTMEEELLELEEQKEEEEEQEEEQIKEEEEELEEAAEELEEAAVVGEEEVRIEGEEVEEEEKLEEESVKSEEEEEEKEEEEGEEEESKKEGEGFKVKEKDEIEEKGVKFGEDTESAETQTKKEVFKRRMSVRKKSIFYPKQDRFQKIRESRVSGDFAAIQADLLGRITSVSSIKSYEPEVEEYIIEEEVEEEEEIPIDREYYYNRYKDLMSERIMERIKNNYFQRKMAEYFKKRKMEHVLKETDQQMDSQQKYERKLEALAELKEIDTRERNSIKAEVDDLRNQRDEQLAAVENNFIIMQNREKEMGTGLINTKTGKEIPDKLVERLLKRQKDKWKEVAEMRLKYIKIRNKVNEKKTALHALDCIGENLHLIDYEQLKIEKQSHTDKIEERDEELNRLRIKCQGAMQCLAHIREKSAALQLDMLQLDDRFEDVDLEYSECRERLNYFKQERDYYRLQIDKISEESGLLTKPKLLLDMEQALEETDVTTKQLEKLKKENQRLQDSLKNIKRNIALAAEKSPALMKPTGTVPKGSKSKICKGRPALIRPKLSDLVEDD